MQSNKLLVQLAVEKMVGLEISRKKVENSRAQMDDIFQIDSLQLTVSENDRMNLKVK